MGGRGRERRDRDRARVVGLTIALAIVLRAAGGPEVHAQGPGVGGGGGGGPGGGMSGGSGLEPSGSSINAEVSDEVGHTGEAGGLSGGHRQRGGTAGAATRSRLSGSPGDKDASRLGPPLGASGTAGFDNAPGRQGTIIGGRPGITGNRIPAASFQPPGQGPNPDQGRRLRQDRLAVKPPGSDPVTLARRPKLELPANLDDPGPADGLTLDGAIALLIARNLNLMALRFEVPKADADILTAGLRNNPILYGDTQFVPYGHYTNLRPGGGGGQPQYDVNITYPIDVNGKRRARVAVAEKAKRVTEAQLQDAVRTMIDDLYTSYINVLAARETVRYSEAFLAGITRIFERAEAEARRAEGGDEAKAARDAVDALRDQVRQARFQVRQAARMLEKTKRELVLMLDLPPSRAMSLSIHARLREVRPLPAPAEALVRMALESRPDLAAYRLGVERARADVQLARRNRFADVYLVYQPYTLQAGRAFGTKGTYSYALGVNASLPIYNRNQGNIARAESNVQQTRVELASLERRVVHEVSEQVRDVELSRAGVLELERDVLPATRLARDDAFAQYREDPSKVNEYIDKQETYNEVVQQFRNALIEHRQAMLDLNTAVGARVVP